MDHLPKELLTFLGQLRRNNTREWFLENRETYEQAFKKPAEAFTEQLCDALSEWTGRVHRSKIFRIHRDVRFSRDKTPYNTHLHLAFTPSVDAAITPAWFFGLEPGKLTLGTGVFAMEKKQLDAFRRRVAGEDGDRLLAIFHQFPKEIGTDAPELKRVPPPYPSDHPHGELLRRKSLAGWIDLPEEHAACAPGFIDQAIARFGQLKPLHDWFIAKAA